MMGTPSPSQGLSTEDCAEDAVMHPGQPLTTSGLSESRPGSARTGLSCLGSVAFGPTWRTGREKTTNTPDASPNSKNSA